MLASLELIELFSGDVLYCYESICSHGYPTNTGAHIRGMSRGIEILSHT